MKHPKSHMTEVQLFRTTSDFKLKLEAAAVEMELPAATLVRRAVEVVLEALEQYNYPRLRELKISLRESVSGEDQARSEKRA